MQNLAIAGIVVGVAVFAAGTGFLVFELLRVIGTLVPNGQLWHEKTLALTRLRLAVTLSNGMGKATKITRSICGDASMGELRAMLRRAAKLSDSAAPRIPSPTPEAKLEQQLSNPIAQEALARVVGTMRILADIVAMDTEQLIGLFLFGVFVGFAAYAFVALIQSI